jgi:ATP-dependent DNA helicase RecG
VLIREQMRTYRFSGDPSLAAYPADAVHEVLVNAVCHRDYRVREPVAVRLDDDHLTITSPGGLPGCMTLAHLGDGRCSRNPRIAWSLHRLGYVPEPGRGIRRLRAIMSQHSRPPQFTAEPYSVTVRLAAAQIAPDNTGTGQPTATAPTLNPRQQAALAHVETHGSITLREFGTLCNGTHTADLRRDLSDLVACGRLRKVGARGRAYYIAG